MKLYASVKSERAEEGQGGNDFLIIKITDDKREEIASLEVLPGDKKKISITVNKDKADLEFKN